VILNIYREDVAGYVWLKKETDRYLTKYTPISPQIYYNNDEPSTSYAPPTQPIPHGIKVSPKSSFKKKLTSLGTFFKGSKKNKVFPAAPSNINKRPVTTQPSKAAPPAINLSKPSPKGKALMPKRNGTNAMASKVKSQANATNSVKSPLKPIKQLNQIRIRNTEPSKTEKTSFTRRQPNTAKLTEKNSKASPKKIKIVQTKTSKMRACRNLSTAKTPMNQINKAKTCQKQKETPNKKQLPPTIPKQKMPTYKKMTTAPASQPIPLPSKTLYPQGNCSPKYLLDQVRDLKELASNLLQRCQILEKQLEDSLQ